MYDGCCRYDFFVDLFDGNKSTSQNKIHSCTELYMTPRLTEVHAQRGIMAIHFDQCVYNTYATHAI